ncbi:DUF6745 domain-containing protein [Chamaesiphon polymorphus]|uniref:DUF6745 domain-containing protein n=1 Tax=Chamaesiphon polymorphus CCALA 037 TaxID=2107692 RepID=A0A2T1FDW4_9CYAN|nr:hypothetical protein [Chamaesiphon polymorphus]PSB43180.1 hypothetical protein C7B77_26280 [Chamaesiphon polymorphus CCALA 037]
MIESIDDLIVFLKHFHRNLLEDPSLPPEQIPDDLPEGLAKIYRELGGLIALEQHPGPFNAQDTLIIASPHNGKIVFCFENQGCWAAMCPADRQDPPVYLTECDEYTERDEDFELVCDSLNHFLITLCLQEAVFGSLNLVCVHKADNILDTIIAKEKFQPLWLNGQYAYIYRLQDFYISEDRDMLIMNNGWVGSQTRQILDIFDPNIDPKIRIRIHGVDLPRRYWTKFSEWKAEWLFDEENAEIRRVLIEQVGYEKICKELNAIEIDTWREYTLMIIDGVEVEYDEENDELIDIEPMVLLKMTCPSTNHIHILRVPPDTTSAEAAITWVNHGIHPDKFAIQT